MILQNLSWVKGHFKIKERPMDFKVTDYKTLIQYDFRFHTASSHGKTTTCQVWVYYQRIFSMT